MVPLWAVAGSREHGSTPPGDGTPDGAADAEGLLESLEEAEVADSVAGELVDPSGDFAWESALGATRHASVHVPLFGGIVRTVRVHTAVNLATHPELRERVLAGDLHRLDGGEALAIPYLLHDPDARKLAIVVPEALRHEALRERARFFQALADDVDEAVPPYVLDAALVIGPGELAELLDAAPAVDRLPALRRHAALITVRENHVSAWERRLEELEAVLDAREDELDQLEEDLVLTEEELLTRARDLDDRLEAVARVEDELAEEADPVDVDAVAGDVAEVVDDLDAVADEVSEGRLAASVELVDDAGAVPSEGPSASVDADDVLAIEAGAEASTPPPDGLFGDAADGDALAARVGPEGVVVFVRCAPSTLEAFTAADPVLRVQAVAEGRRRLLVAADVGAGGVSVAVDLDPAVPADREVLGRLAAPYDAAVQLYDLGGSHARTLALRGRGFPGARVEPGSGEGNGGASLDRPGPRS